MKGKYLVDAAGAAEAMQQARYPSALTLEIEWPDCVEGSCGAVQDVVWRATGKLGCDRKTAAPSAEYEWQGRRAWLGIDGVLRPE